MINNNQTLEAILQAQATFLSVVAVAAPVSTDLSVAREGIGKEGFGSKLEFNLVVSAFLIACDITPTSSDVLRIVNPVSFQIRTEVRLTGRLQSKPSAQAGRDVVLTVNIHVLIGKVLTVNT